MQSIYMWPVYRTCVASVTVGQNQWKHNSTLVTESHKVKIVFVLGSFGLLVLFGLIWFGFLCLSLFWWRFFFLVLTCGYEKTQQKVSYPRNHIKTCIWQRKNKFLICQCLWIELENREQKNESCRECCMPWPFEPGTFVLYLMSPKVCAKDLFCSVNSEKQSDPGIKGKEC